ncbi:MAG: hypothetical protein IKB42_04960 [Clostridia bacterium]|nr:hypothetical protein [Clostridia bacterium]
MTIEDLVKLTEMYQVLKDEGSILPAQKAVYDVSTFLADTAGALFDDKYFKHIKPETVQSFRTIGADKYADLIEYYLQQYETVKKPKSLYSIFIKNLFALDLNSEFLNKLDKLLETDSLTDNYIEKYLKDNNLDKDIQLYNKFEKIRAVKEKNKKKVRRDRIIFLSIFLSSLMMFLIPILIAAIDFGADGNTYNPVTTRANFVAMGVAVVALLISTLYIDKIKRTLWKVVLNIIAVFTAMFVAVFISPDATFFVYIIGAYEVSFLCYYLKNRKFRLLVQNDKSVTNLFFKQSKLNH